MKIYNEKVGFLGEAMTELLKTSRNKRSFSAESYINDKIHKIERYFNKCGLNTAVVAISGGVDSAIVLGLLKRTSLLKNSSLKNIIAITLPAKNNNGVSGQDKSRERALELSKVFDIIPKDIDVSIFSNSISEEIEKSLDIKAGNWAKGQLVPYLRTSMLYYFTNLLTQEGNKAVLVGTTNADEGQYLGYIGKASDGMVDIQPISDIHKREVYLVAKKLGVPESIINVAPTGDMYDNRTDEEVFGAPYEFVEAYYSFLKLSKEEKEALLLKIESADEMEIFKELSNNLENMHSYNKHKYMGCSPAVHLDIFEMRIKGGWKYYVWENDDEK